MSFGRAEEREMRRPALHDAPRNTLLSLTLHELRMRAWGMTIWGIVLGLYVGTMVAAYPSFEGQMSLDQYPRAFREAFGITDMGTITGFLSAQFFNTGPLILSFFPILVLSAAIAGAEECGTIDVLLGKPVPRWQLVVGNFLTVAISLLGILTLLTLFVWIPATLFDVGLPLGPILEGTLNLWPICLFFGGLALLCSAVFHRRVLAIAVPVAVLFGMYLLDVLGGIVEDVEAIHPLSAFYYYDSAIVDGIDWANFAGLTLAAPVPVVLAVLAFRRRDIYT